MQKRAQKTANDFEAVFLNSMFSQMTSGLKGDGPFGETTGTGPWRAMMTDQYRAALRQSRRHRHFQRGLSLAHHSPGRRRQLPPGTADTSIGSRIMTKPQPAPALSLADVRKLAESLMDVMTTLLTVIENETALVRAGKLRDAMALEAARPNCRSAMPASSPMSETTRIAWPRPRPT